MNWVNYLEAATVSDNSVNWFDGGQSFPPGEYVVRYEGGCMKYSSSQGWTVHKYDASSGSSIAWHLITVSFNFLMPALPPPQVLYYADYEACVTGNKDPSHREATFTHVGGPIGFFLLGSSGDYENNIAGASLSQGANPTWSLDKKTP